MIPIKRSIKTLPFHIFVLPFFFALKTIDQYAGLMDVDDSIIPFTKVLAGALVCFVLLYLFLKNAQKAGCIATILGVFILFFDNIKEIFRSLPLLDIFSHYRFYLPLILIVSAFIVYKITKAKKLTKLNSFLNVLLVMYFLVEIWNFSRIKKSAIATTSELNEIHINPTSEPTRTLLPNIYFILLDCYPSTSYLEEVLRVNNSYFDSSLRSKNFYLAANSASNYNRTAFSMASTLNMGYLKWLKMNGETTVTDYAQALSAMRHPRAYSLLKKAGYQFYNLSMFTIDDHLPIYKENFLTASSEQVMFYNTFWSFLWRQWYWKFELDNVTHSLTTEEMRKKYEPQKQYNDSVLDSLFKLSKQKEKKAPFFLYAHMYLPHFPYFYNEEGKPYDTGVLYNDSLITDRKKFIGYLTYTNQKVISFLDTLFHHNGGRDVVILQSDHGIADINPYPKQSDAFRNYFAVYLPDQDYRLLYDSISNVNTFRVILNKYCNYDFTILDDKSFYLKN